MSVMVKVCRFNTILQILFGNSLKNFVWWSRIFECSDLTLLGFEWFQLEEASYTTRFASDAKIPIYFSFYMCILYCNNILEQFYKSAVNLLWCCRFQLVVVGVKRKRSACTALPLHSLQISPETVSPSYRVSGVWEGLAVAIVASSVLQNT